MAMFNDEGLAPEAEKETKEELERVKKEELEAAGREALGELEEEEEEFLTTEEALERAEEVIEDEDDEPLSDLEAAIKLVQDAGLHISEELERVDLEPEEAVALSRDERKRHFAQVLTRGRVNSKVQAILDRYVPEGRAGKLIRDTPADIAAYENLGFTFVEGEGLHGTADGRIRVGDTVLMSISLEDQEILRELRGERVLQNVGGAAESEFMKNSELGYNESETRIGGK